MDDNICKKFRGEAKQQIALPKDVLKLIIGLYPCPQWFILSKEVNLLASEVISPLDHRKEDHCAFCWATKNNKILAVISLLKHPHIDPSHNNNDAIFFASKSGNKEIVQILLNDRRVDPCDKRNAAIRWASQWGYKEVVEVLLKDGRADPAFGDNYAIRYASIGGHKEIVELLLQGIARCCIGDLTPSRSSCGSFSCQ
jgi:hypothetical protein